MTSERSVTGGRRALALFLLDNGILLALVVEVVIFSLASPDVFFTPANGINILRFAALGGILVACYTCAMIAGQLDLSTPQVGGFAAVIFAVLFQIAQWPLVAALVVALLVAAAVGLLNSWLISRLGIPSLVATLAVGTLCLGIAYLIVDALGQSGAIRITRPPLRSVVGTELFGVPITVYIMFAVYLILYVVLNHTKVGAHLYAIGGNARAAQLNAIPNARLIRLVMILTAVAAGFTSIVLSGRQLAAGPFISALGASSSGSLAAPASPLVAALFAGVALSGGSGRIERTLLGVLFLAVLSIGMAILNLPVFVRLLIEGLAFVAAILLDSVRRRIETR